MRNFFMLALLLTATGAASVHAQSTYPARAIRMVVAWPPGGGTDVLARIICARLGESSAHAWANH